MIVDETGLIISDTGSVVDLTAIDKVKPYEEICADALETYLQASPLTVTTELILDKSKGFKAGVLGFINYTLRLESASKGRKLKSVENLTASQTSRIIRATGDVKVIVMDSAAGKVRQLAILQHSGEHKGIYVRQYKTCMAELHALIFALNSEADERFCNTVLYNLTNTCETVEPVQDGIRVACNNGVYNLETKEFTGWDDPDYKDRYGKCAFVKKLKINYNANVTLHDATIHNDADGTDWDPEYQIDSCLDDPSARQLIWETYNFLFRGKSGGKVVWLLNSSGMAGGGGGKSTVTSMGRNVVGTENVLMKSIDEISEDRFSLYPLPEKVAIMANETNSSTSAVKNATIYKNLSRCQPISCEGKGLNGFTYVFRGQIVYETNGVPKFVEQSHAVHRKEIFLHFEKNFDNGNPREYIIKDYVNRTNVLEYVLKKALELGPLEQFSPDCVKSQEGNLKEVKASNSKVYEFMDVVADTFLMNTVPVDLLYDTFKAYDEVCNGAKYHMEKRRFKMELQVWCADNPDWDFVKGSVRIPKGTPSEYVIAEYGYKMDGWQAKPQVGAVDITTGGEIAPEKYASTKTYTDGIKRTPEGVAKRQGAKTEAADKQQREDEALYTIFRAKWFEVNIDQLISRSLTPEKVPTMETWAQHGKPQWNKSKQTWDSYSENYTLGRVFNDYKIKYEVPDSCM